MELMPMRYLTHIDRALYEYYTTLLAVPSVDQENPDYRNPELAELAETIVHMLEEEIESNRRNAARWRGEN